jgi:hypothetical protein
MVDFKDRLALRFLDDAFVSDLISNQIGLNSLFDFSFHLNKGELQAVSLQSVGRRQFERPVFETLRMSGTEYRQSTPPESVQIKREHPRQGRLTWIDVFLEARLSATVRPLAGEGGTIKVHDLLAELGDPSDLSELRNALADKYGESAVDAIFKTLGITTFEEFRDRGSRFISLASEAPPPFDPQDPANTHHFRLPMCFRFEEDLSLLSALNMAKLCRSVLEHERQHREEESEAEVRRPYAFVVVFPDSAAVDGLIPGATAADIKASTRQLFAAEEMVAHFMVEG